MGWGVKVKEMLKMGYILQNSQFIKMRYLIILFVFVIITIMASCKSVYKVHDKEGNLIFKKETINDSIKKNTFYNKKGDVIKTSYYKLDYKEEDVKRFYNNGKLYQKGKEKYKKKDGWWYTYDSIESNIIRKEYFINSRKYTHIELDALGKCKYYEMRPYIFGYEDIDTIIVNKTDSLPFRFFFSSNNLDIKEISIMHFPYGKEDDCSGYVDIFPFTGTQYIYMKNIFREECKSSLYYVEYNGLNNDESICCCDSVYLSHSSRFIRINR